MSGAGVADDVIRAFFERWQRLEAEKAAISDDLRELFAEMKGNGFDTKVARKVFRDKTVDQNERAEFEAIYDLYWSALSGPRAGRAHAHVENIEEFDVETGEITEPQRSPAAQSRGEHRGATFSPAGDVPTSTPSTGQGGDESPVNNSPETANDLPAQESGGNETCSESEPLGKSNAARPASVDAHVNDGGLAGKVSDDVVTAGETAPPFQSSDLHDGRLQAGSASALDKSGDSATGAEASVAPITYPVAGERTYEHCPPEPVRWHEYANCFPETTIDLGSTGVQKPIVKIGNMILDGRSRYHAARDAGIAYPVVQYAGSDPLADVIRWNLEARDMTEKARRAVAERLAGLVPDRADEIMSMFGLAVVSEAAE